MNSQTDTGGKSPAIINCTQELKITEQLQDAKNGAESRENPHYNTYAKAPKAAYEFATSDTLLAAASLILGFLFWQWNGFAAYKSGQLGLFLFFILAISVSLIYMKSRGIRQNKKSLTVLAVALIGALPFALYDGIPINFYLLIFEFAACLIWLAYSCKTEISGKLSGFILGDWANQFFCVPFCNFAALFGSIFRRANRGSRRSKVVLSGAVGIVISIPLLILIVTLLISADRGFEYFTSHIADYLNIEHLGQYILKFVLGIPVACYICGALYGNAHKRMTSNMSEADLAQGIAKAHGLPRAGVIAPIAILNLLYVVFFSVMGSYLFSAFGGSLPTGYTYAEYARQGFFELCGVAAINLIVLAAAYLFARRSAGEYPKSLRILTAVLSGLTVLLIATAISKMLMYVETYGLSRLRVYTLWFMVLLILVFITLIVWHIKPFNAGRPIVLIAVAFTLALFLSNSDGFIAKYNVEHYESGRLKTIDVEMLGYMSDAVLPYLRELGENAPDADVRGMAKRGIESHRERYYSYSDEYGKGAYVDESKRFHCWNLQSAYYSGIR
ncbi:MAG: DUF4173 domain-containing protein [Clostridiales Family XIII bacterium]|jgi:hypothetical protein|nr:DUF4173 domain-containing protein [Clostridiales Family XIII bacterium]